MLILRSFRFSLSAFTTGDVGALDVGLLLVSAVVTAGGAAQASAKAVE
jgi:hypothetical protein